MNTTEGEGSSPSTTDDIGSSSPDATSPGISPKFGTAGTPEGTSPGKPTTQTSPTTSTTTTTEYVPPAPPPPPYIPYPNNNDKRNPIHSDSATNTALVIGIIAGTMIAIILIILIVLKLKNRSGVVYKVDERKVYGVSSCQGQNAALLNQSPPTPQAINGQVKNGNGKTKKRETKDIKEWYV